MRRAKWVGLIVVVLGALANHAWAYTYNGLGAAGGWDNILKSNSVSAVIDKSDFTTDNGLTTERVNAALVRAFNTWDAVTTAPQLNFNILPDLGGNYDAFDGPNDSAGPAWFNGYSSTLDAAAHWRYANIVIGGWLPQSYFTNLDAVNGANILAVAWTGKLSGDGSKQPAWHAEIFFNDGWSWTDDPTIYAGAIDIETIALHEIGHTIGLGHEDDVASVMGTYYEGVQRVLYADDIAGISSLYGPAPGGGKKKSASVNGLFGDEADEGSADASMTPEPVPEPATLALLALGLLGLAGRRPNRRR